MNKCNVCLVWADVDARWPQVLGISTSWDVWEDMRETGWRITHTENYISISEKASVLNPQDRVCKGPESGPISFRKQIKTMNS